MKEKQKRTSLAHKLNFVFKYGSIKRVEGEEFEIYKSDPFNEHKPKRNCYLFNFSFNTKYADRVDIIEIRQYATLDRFAKNMYTWVKDELIFKGIIK